jgi:hypothetical protein
MKPKPGNIIEINGEYAVVYSDYGTGLNIVYFDGRTDVLVHNEQVDIIAPHLNEFHAIAFGYDG